MNEWKELIDAFRSEEKSYCGVINCIEWLIEHRLDDTLQSMLSHGRLFISCREQLLAGAHRSVTLWPCSDTWMDIGFEELWNIGEEQNLRREQVKCKHENAVPHFTRFISRLIADNKSLNQIGAQNAPPG